jgi:hypothetical protein
LADHSGQNSSLPAHCFGYAFEAHMGDARIVRVEQQISQRLPTGPELSELFNAVNVDESDLVSEAEKGWLYGDPVGSESDEKPH